MARVLLIEDQADFQLSVKSLIEPPHQVDFASSAHEALSLIQKSEFDLILLDVTLPDESGFYLISKLRKLDKLKGVPIIFLTGKGEITDRVTGFSLGAEDYIVKPFDPLEFKARIEAKLAARISKSRELEVIRKGRIEINRSMFRACVLDPEGNARDLNLTPHELRLLVHLISHEGQVFTRDQLITQIWGTETHVLERTVDRHVSTLRRKLEPGSERIESVQGVGYRFVATSSRLS